MSRWRHHGGWNKSHGTVEKTPRIDSYEAGTVEGWGYLFAYIETHEKRKTPHRDLQSAAEQPKTTPKKTQRTERNRSFGVP